MSPANTLTPNEALTIVQVIIERAVEFKIPLPGSNEACLWQKKKPPKKLGGKEVYGVSDVDQYDIRSREYIQCSSQSVKIASLPDDRVLADASEFD